MEIIRQGKLPGDRQHTATCNNCKTRVRFQQSEGHVTCDQRDGNFVTVICPICKGQIHDPVGG